MQCDVLRNDRPDILHNTTIGSLRYFVINKDEKSVRKWHRCICLDCNFWLSVNYFVRLKAIQVFVIGNECESENPLKGTLALSECRLTNSYV